MKKAYLLVYENGVRYVAVLPCNNAGVPRLNDRTHERGGHELQQWFNLELYLCGSGDFELAVDTLVSEVQEATSEGLAKMEVV